MNFGRFFGRVFHTKELEDGRQIFEEFGDPVIHSTDLTDLALIWKVPASPSLPFNVGFPASDTDFPEPGEVKVGIARVGAKSAGKLNISETHSESQLKGFVVPKDNPGMHETNSIDFEYVVSGKVDLELGDGSVRTIGAGDFVVQGGTMHSWNNSYEEDCVFVVVIVGAERRTRDAV